MTTCIPLQRPCGVKSIRLAFGAVLFILICVINLPAQTSHSVTDSRTPSALQPGAPAGSFQLSGFDNINPYNGHLNFALPLLQIGGRGEAGYTITLPIERTWKSVVRTYYTGPGNCGSCQPPDKFPEPNEWKGIENGFGAGVVVGRGSRDRDPDPSINGGGVNYECQTLTRFTYTKPDGTEVELRDYITDGRPHRSWGSEKFPRGTVFFARDGSATTFLSDHPIRDVACNDDDPAVRWGFNRIFPNGYLLFKNGVRQRVLNGRVVWIQDRNGNQVTFGGGGVIDALGRTTEFIADVGITYKGVGGVDRTIGILRAPLSQALRSDIPSTKTYRQLFPDLMGGSDTTEFNPDVISAVVLPNGKRYTLRYNEYGELARVQLPTGGAFEYDHNGEVISSSRQIYRRVIERRVYKDGATGAAYESKTTYSYPSHVMINNEFDSLVTVKDYDHSGQLVGLSRHIFRGLASESLTTTTFIWYEKFDIGRETQTDILSTDGNETLLKRTTNKYENYPHITPPWWTDGYLSEWPRPQDPYLKETTTLLADTNQISKQVFKTDQWGNLSDIYDYDYGTGAPPPYPVRHKHTDYLTTNPVNNIDYTSMGGLHLRDLASAQSVYAVNPSNGAETLIARSSSGYDQGTVSDCPGIIKHAAGFDTGYTTRGNVTSNTIYEDPLNWGGARTTWMAYDIAGNLVQTTDPRNNASWTEYGDSFSDEINRNTYAYPTRTLSPVPDPTNERASNTSLETKTAYDFSTGNITSITDANGQIIYPRYAGDDNVADPLDRLRRIEYPDGGVTKYNYFDTVGDLYRQTISYRGANQTNPVEARQYFDGLGRQTRTFLFDGTASTPWSVTDTYYDALGRVEKISNPYRVAAPGVALPTTCNLCTTTAYDALDRVRTVTTPDNAQASMSYSGNTVTATDQAGKRRKSVTDALGRLKTVYEDPSDSGYTGLNYQTNYTYDAQDNLRKVEQGGQLRYFMYDSLGRLVRARNPEQIVNSGLTIADAFKAPEDAAPNDQWTMAYSYDANGNLETKTDARNFTTNYTYDPLNRVMNTTYSDGVTPGVYQVYDKSARGRGKFAWNWTYLNANSANSHTVVHEYDPMGRATSQSQHFWINNAWGQAYSTQYIYDKMGRVTSQTYPSGRTISHTQFDAAGRAKNFTGNLGDGTQRTYAANITYDEAGRMQEEQFGTNTALYHKLQFNSRGQLIAARLSTKSQQQDFYNYNRGALIFDYGTTENNGNLTSQQHWVPGNDQITAQTNIQQNYGYDALSRLTLMQEFRLVDGFKFQQAYDYDRWGNRTLNLSTTDGINKTQFDTRNQAATNRIYAPGDLDIPDPNQRRMRYDAAGNLVYDNYTPESGTGERTYDGENRMTGMRDKYGYMAYYTYDATGQRTRRKTQSQEVWQVYGIDGQLLAEYAANAAPAAPQKEYGYRNGELLIAAESVSSGSSAAPANLSAAPANAGTRVTLGWGTVAGAPKYRVERATVKGGAFTLKGTPQANTFMDEDITPGQAYLYQVCAADSAGNCTSAYGNVALATAYAFTDDPIITLAEDPSGTTVTRIQALHVTQLRAAINAVRAAAGLSAASWGESVTAGRLLHAAHVQELRDRLNEALTELSVPVPTYTDSVLEVHLTGIKRAHFAELRLGATRGSGTAQSGGSVGTANILWLVADHLGTPRMIADLSGNLDKIKRHDYLPFGEELGAGLWGRTASQGYGQFDGNRKKWALLERDDETGLDYAQARYYSSVKGRFTSPDEFTGGPDELFNFADDAADNPTFYADLANPQSLNKYQYTYNNPLRYNDPSGHCPVVICNPSTAELAKRAAERAGAITAGIGAVAGAIATIVKSGPTTADPSCPACSNWNNYYQKRLERQEAERQNLHNQNNSGDQSNSSNEEQRKTGKRNVEVQHSNRKEAKEAAEHPHPGKKKPTPPKSNKKKRREYEEQQKYRYPERHRDSKYPDSHFHDRDKSKNRKVNKHHKYPK